MPGSRLVYQGIWEKATRLLCHEGSMAPAPGYPPEARTVQSTSKNSFHLVTSASGGRFSCDCANYRSLNICSHSVAVAEVNKKLGHFVEWYRKTNKLASLSQLATADLPKGRGHKGGQPPRKKQKKAPISTRVDMIQASSSRSSSLPVPTPTITSQSSPNPIASSFGAPSSLPPFHTSYPSTSVSITDSNLPIPTPTSTLQSYRCCPTLLSHMQLHHFLHFITRIPMLLHHLPIHGGNRLM